MTAMNIRRVPLSDLHEDVANVRLHDKTNLAAIKASLLRFMQVEPLVVQRGSMRVIGGNGRLQAMRELKWEFADVYEVDLQPSEQTALGIVLNRSSELAKWDEKGLSEMLGSLKSEGFALGDLGFGNDEFAKLANGGGGGGGEGGTGKDETPDPRPEAFSKRGDLWLLGAHRVLCGDSTKTGDVERVMGGKKAGLMNTDPPYGVAYANDERPNPGVAKPRVAKDDLCDDALQRFLESAFRPAKEIALGEKAAWYLWHAHLTQGFFAAAAAAAAAAANVVLHRQIIWVKPVLLLGRGQYHWKHEPCFMGWVDGCQPPDYGLGGGERTQTTVWEIGSVTQAERKEFDHSTPKPVGLFTIPILKHLRAGEIAYDPFLGSGPQVIAAEQLGRRCFGLEIEPRYVDVICRRWAKFTGKLPVREGDGVEFPVDLTPTVVSASPAPDPAEVSS